MNTDIYSFINIIGTIRDLSVLRTVALTDQIKDKILDENQETINSRLVQEVKNLKKAGEGCVGFFENPNDLESVEDPQLGQWAIVPSETENVWKIWTYDGDQWTETDQEYERPQVSLNGYLTDAENELKYLQLKDYPSVEIANALARYSTLTDDYIKSLISTFIIDPEGLGLNFDEIIEGKVEEKTQNFPTAEGVKQAVLRALPKIFTEDEIKDIARSVAGTPSNVDYEIINNYIDGKLEDYNPVLVDDNLSDISENPVQNKVIKSKLDEKADLGLLQDFVKEKQLEHFLENLQLQNGRDKGLFNSLLELIQNYPTAEIGDWAIVKNDDKWYIAQYGDNGWEVTDNEWQHSIDLTAYIKRKEVEELYQKILISGVTIKKINGEDITGPGNLTIQTGGTGIDSRTIGDIKRNVYNDLITYLTENYYSNKQTLTSNEIQTLINQIPKYSIKPVDQLPTEDIDDNALYLLNSSSSSVFFEEWIHDENGWKKIGQANLSLDGYLTWEDKDLKKLRSDLDKKQDKLVDRENIKTINNISLLGTGNIDLKIPTDTIDSGELEERLDLLKKEIKYLIEARDLIVVEELPTNNINDGAIYLLPGNNGQYNQWIHDDEGWHNIGVFTLNLDNYQLKLKSGENIKTINGQSLLGSGNIVIQSADPSSGDNNFDPNQYYTKGETYNREEIEGLVKIKFKVVDTLPSIENDIDESVIYLKLKEITYIPENPPEYIPYEQWVHDENGWHCIGTTDIRISLKTINGETLFGDGNIDIEQNVTQHVTQEITQEVTQYVTNIGGFKIVDDLPTTVSEESKIYIYLKPKEISGNNNSTNVFYEQWVYYDNDWHLIGTTEMDLSNYVKKDNIKTINNKSLLIDSGEETNIEIQQNVQNVTQNIIQQVANIGGFKVVDDLPQTLSEEDKNYIYLRPKRTPTLDGENPSEEDENPVYEQWVYYDTWQLIGTSNVNLSGYQEKLKSGVNIKTIDTESILGDGDLKETINRIIENYLENHPQQGTGECSCNLQDAYDYSDLLTGHLEKRLFGGINKETGNYEEGKFDQYLDGDTIIKLINNLSKLNIEIVDSLPGENISENTIYLVETAEGSSVYNQYLYNKGEWKNLGTTQINLNQLQDKLISGQNIKTINNYSILGNGNIPFKTINRQPLTGAGNIDFKTVGGKSLFPSIEEGEPDITFKTLGDSITQEDKSLLAENQNTRISFRTINGQTIFGSTNIPLLKADGHSLTGTGDLNEWFLTKEEYDDIQNPFKVTISANPNLIEYDPDPNGEGTTITISGQAKKGSTNISASYQVYYVKSLNENVPLNDMVEPITNPPKFLHTIKELGTYKYMIAAINSKNQVTTDSTTVRIILPTYIGFSSEPEDKALVDLSTLTKKVKTSISMTETIENTVSGSYLYIITPLTVSLVATDPGFTYKVTMLNKGTLNGFNYYRSSSAVDISNLTYYIK